MPNLITIAAPSPIPFGLAEAMESAGIVLQISPDGWGVSDPDAAAHVMATYEPKPSAIAYMRSQVTAAKWRAIEGGVSVGGIPVTTDADSRAMLQGLAIAASAGAIQQAPFKAADGVFRTLTGQQALAIFAAVVSHVQACYAREAELFAAIDAAPTWQDVMEIDPGAGFPSNG